MELPPADLDKVVAKTEGYSGSDMRNFIQEACQAPVRGAYICCLVLYNPAVMYFVAFIQSIHSRGMPSVSARLGIGRALQAKCLLAASTILIAVEATRVSSLRLDACLSFVNATVETCLDRLIVHLSSFPNMIPRWRLVSPLTRRKGEIFPHVMDDLLSLIESLSTRVILYLTALFFPPKVRDAMALHGSAVQQLVEEDLRPIR